MSNVELSLLFFLQLASILVVCRAVGWLARRVGQPQAIGEMIAGVLLGPSLFGLLAPDAQAWLFPRGAAMTLLYCVAQLGLVLYMFLVGVEFRTDLFRQQQRSAAAVSIAGMVVPFALGGLLGWRFAAADGLFTRGVTSVQAALFLGAAMAITAFPMLARIIQERGITGTPLGTLTLAAGAVGDGAAWCVLAVLLATFNSDAGIAVMAIGGGLAFVVLVTTVVRPALHPLGRLFGPADGAHAGSFSLVLAGLMLVAWFTDRIGIHAVFGAFILGTAMPRGHFAHVLQQRIAPLTTTFLVPLFFVYSGLNTRIDLVASWELWGLAALVLAIACVGKLGACWAAARCTGSTPRDAFAIAALMNARGMMELIILNIGLQRGLITPQLFTIMVLMAIVTTLMATPLYCLAHPGRPVGDAIPSPPPDRSSAA